MLRDTITQTMKDAMRARDEAVTSTARMVNAAIKQKDIDVARARGDERISDDEILSLLQSMIKSRRESIELYTKGGRPELADKEEAEIAIIERFLPKQMSEDEVQAATTAIITDIGAVTIKDMGKVMATVKATYAGQMDMTKASALVKTLLTSPKV